MPVSVDPTKPFPRLSAQSSDIQPWQQQDEHLLWLAQPHTAPKHQLPSWGYHLWSNKWRTLTFLTTAFLCFIPVQLTFLLYFQGERKEKLYPNHQCIKVVKCLKSSYF